ncbi:MAG TPA: FtsL-like putative cell division protein, partial [Pricia sp.]|nr:FtsL-like putative cell division protein [Pricia sp.]
MIGSSHSADKKVHQIAALNEEVKELRSEFVDVRSDMQQLKLESTVMHIVEGNGLYPSEVPPKQIKVKSQINSKPKSIQTPKSNNNAYK